MVHRSVLIVEDHDAYRSGLCRVIDNSEHFRVVGETGDCHEAVRLAKLHQPDVTVMDADLSGATGPCVTRVLRSQRREAMIVLLGMEFDQGRLIEAMRAGVSAYLAKELGGQALVSTLSRVLAGENLFREMIMASPVLASRVLAEFQSKVCEGRTEINGMLQPLSDDERAILEGIALGIQAQRSPSLTAGDAIDAVLRKLYDNDRAQTKLFAASHGWFLDLPPVAVSGASV
jgi:DNA-binding NarL/FixJ family response regulator